AGLRAKSLRRDGASDGGSRRRPRARRRGAPIAALEARARGEPPARRDAVRARGPVGPARAARSAGADAPDRRERSALRGGLPMDLRRLQAGPRRGHPGGALPMVRAADPPLPAVLVPADGPADARRALLRRDGRGSVAARGIGLTVHWIRGGV